jgi:hypothetical protein
MRRAARCRVCACDRLPHCLVGGGLAAPTCGPLRGGAKPRAGRPLAPCGTKRRGERRASGGRARGGTGARLSPEVVRDSAGARAPGPRAAAPPSAWDHRRSRRRPPALARRAGAARSPAPAPRCRAEDRVNAPGRAAGAPPGHPAPSQPPQGLGAIFARPRGGRGTPRGAGVRFLPRDALGPAPRAPPAIARARLGLGLGRRWSELNYKTGSVARPHREHRTHPAPSPPWRARLRSPNGGASSRTPRAPTLAPPRAAGPSPRRRGRARRRMGRRRARSARAPAPASRASSTPSSAAPWGLSCPATRPAWRASRRLPWCGGGGPRRAAHARAGSWEGKRAGVSPPRVRAPARRAARPRAAGRPASPNWRAVHAFPHGAARAPRHTPAPHCTPCAHVPTHRRAARRRARAPPRPRPTLPDGCPPNPRSRPQPTPPGRR